MPADTPSTQNDPTEKPEGKERLPYAPPTLRRLGSVRALTLGMSNNATEGGMRAM
jgi:hypothetical protein